MPPPNTNTLVLFKGTAHLGPLLSARFGAEVPVFVFSGEIQKGTGGRGRDRKCHKLS